MLHQMKHLDSAFRATRNFAMVCISGCLLLAAFTTYRGYRMVSRAQQQVYVLSEGTILKAYASGRRDNIAVEARSHVRMFHHYFFTLDPDDKAIEEGIERALYLADGSAKRQYDGLKENGYYSSLISGNISQEITEDSIRVRSDREPYYFRYYGQQKIIRPTTITTRSLVSEGYLRSVARSDNNPHGFLIERWQILENRDRSVQNR